ncbi:uncharacterized protein LOC110682879 isoform X2 [Chenopodium quinoa]|uniref:uncharacterized protein LOC110682879 isoform X2 n=1 Tax=Chenopodium quinoa TaxID=63459 RepID=UPI000B77C9BC|nr:uncharacterized protein LOC110682879 isoform X2 [Chenopodium quinoa]
MARILNSCSSTQLVSIYGPGCLITEGRRYGCLLKMGDYDTLIELLKFQEQTLNVVPDFKNLVIQALLLKKILSRTFHDCCYLWCILPFVIRGGLHISKTTTA